MLVCTASNLVLKRLIKQPRPAGSHKSGYGMPSNHSQFMCFIACYFTLWLLHKASFGARTTKHRSSSEKGSNNDKNSTNSTRSRTSCFCVLAESPLGYAIKIALIAGLWALSFLVIYGRLYLGVHSVEQVAVGGICGVIISVLWYVVVGEICVRPFYPSIVRSQVCRFFYVKDSSSIDNVLLFEYQNYISATEASASLLPPTAKKADLYSLKTSRTGNIRSRGRKERKEKNTSTL